MPSEQERLCCGETRCITDDPVSMPTYQHATFEAQRNAIDLVTFSDSLK